VTFQNRVAAASLLLLCVAPIAAPRETGTVASMSPDRQRISPSDWPRFRYDNANTGYNPSETAISPSNVGTLVQKWAVPTGGTEAPDPIAAYGRVYVASMDGTLTALDRSTGGVLWSVDTGGGVGDAPAAANGLIYVGNDAALLALDAETGQLVWSRAYREGVAGSPVVGSGAVYAGGSSEGMDALNARTGAVRWSQPAATYGQSPTLAYGELFTPSYESDCHIEARDARTGAFLWSATFCPYELESSITMPASGGAVYEYTFGAINAIDAVSGDVQWWAEARGGGLPPAVANGVVFAAIYPAYLVRNEHVVAVSQSTGDLLWGTALRDTSYYSSPAVANGVVYVGSGGHMFALDASDGQILWRTRDMGTTFDGSPAVSDGMLFASDSDGTVYAFGLP
jgi:eukaryotic-like serine/threonine-protein kinase